MDRWIQRVLFRTNFLLPLPGDGPPSGGDNYRSGGLTFYFSSQQGLRIIAWKDKGLTYAQVSDLDVEGAESCVICHGAQGERRKFEGLGKRM